MIVVFFRFWKRRKSWGVVEKVSCFTFNLKSDNQKEKKPNSETKKVSKVNELKIWCNIIMVLDRLPSGRQADRRTDERTYRYQMMLMFLYGCLSVYLPWKCHHVILVLFNSNCTIEVEEYVPLVEWNYCVVSCSHLYGLFLYKILIV